MFAKLLSYGSWVFLTLFAIPSVLVVGSWNSLPGDSMYDVKLTLEQALLLAMSPSAAAKGALHVKYTERRFSDAQKLIANKQSVQGLLYLEKEIAAAKKTIIEAPKAERKQLARQYVVTLRTVSNQLEQEKQHVQNTSPTTTNTTNQGNTQSSGSSGSTPSGGGTNTGVEQIDNTQNEIDDTIGDLERLQLQTQMDAPVASPAQNGEQQNEKSQGDEHRNENATQNQEEKKNQDEQNQQGEGQKNTQQDQNNENKDHKGD